MEFNGVEIRYFSVQAQFSFAIVNNRMGVIAMMLLVFLSCITCKSYAIDCSIPDDPFPIPHHFAQPGNVIIGAIISQAFFFHNSPSFTEEPSRMLINEVM